MFPETVAAVSGPVGLSRAGGRLWPFDQALDDIRSHGAAMAFPYAAGMAPHALAVAWALETLAWRQQSSLGPVAFALALATFARWAGCSAAQAALMERLGRPRTSLGHRWKTVLGARFPFALISVWGWLVPPVGLYAMALSALAGPACLASDKPALGVVAGILRMTAGQTRGLMAYAALSLGGWIVLALNIFGLAAAAVEWLLPSVLGVDAPLLSRMLWGPVGLAGMAYGAFVAVDFIGCAAAVRLHARAGDRRDGGDLHLRLADLEKRERHAHGRHG